MAEQLADLAATPSKAAIQGQDLLGGFSSVLSSSQGTANTYELSSQLPSIQTFLSHNWSVPRLHKFLVLVYHYNLIPALVAMLVVSLVVLALMMLELLPNATVVSVVSDPDSSFTRGVFCLPLGTLAFFLTLFCYHEATRACCPRRRPHTVFLDKTCINQVNAELKTKGIESLAAFLCHSDEMLVVFTGEYMQKLWTVYEVATWLMLNGGARMVVRPTYVPVMLLSTTAVLFAFESIWLLQSVMGYAEPETMTTSVRALCSTLFAIPAFTFLARLAARWTQDREMISEHLANFKFSNAKCFCEDDRKTVQENIEAFVKSAKVCSPDASAGEENIEAFVKSAKVCSPDASAGEAVGAFETLVRRVVPKAMDASFGRVGISYLNMLVANIPRLLMHFEKSVEYVLDDVPGYEVFWGVVYKLFDYLVLCPLLEAYLLQSMRWCKCMRSWCGCVFVGVSGYLGIISCIIIFSGLSSKAIDSPVWFAILLPLYASLVALTFLLYRPIKPVPVERPASLATEG